MRLRSCWGWHGLGLWQWFGSGGVSIGQRCGGRSMSGWVLAVGSIVGGMHGQTGVGLLGVGQRGQIGV